MPLFVSAQVPKTDFQDVRWDTLLVNISVIESLVAADSLKSGLMKDLFQRSGITAEDYRKFHAFITAESPEKQKEFFGRVRDILQIYIKEKHFENFPAPLSLPDSLSKPDSPLPVEK